MGKTVGSGCNALATSDTRNHIDIARQEKSHENCIIRTLQGFQTIRKRLVLHFEVHKSMMNSGAGRNLCTLALAVQAWLARNCKSTGKDGLEKKLNHGKVLLQSIPHNVGHFIPNTAASICPRTLYEEIMVECGDGDASVQAS